MTETWANSEYVDSVRKGKKSFNRLRQEHPNADLDLRGADLSGVDFTDADLRNADLSEANLIGADCSLANRRGASRFFRLISDFGRVI